MLYTTAEGKIIGLGVGDKGGLGVDYFLNDKTS